MSEIVVWPVGGESPDRLEQVRDRWLRLSLSRVHGRGPVGLLQRDWARFKAQFVGDVIDRRLRRRWPGRDPYILGSACGGIARADDPGWSARSYIGGAALSILSRFLDPRYVMLICGWLFLAFAWTYRLDIILRRAIGAYGPGAPLKWYEEGVMLAMLASCVTLGLWAWRVVRRRQLPRLWHALSWPRVTAVVVLGGVFISWYLRGPISAIPRYLFDVNDTWLARTHYLVGVSIAFVTAVFALLPLAIRRPSHRDR